MRFAALARIARLANAVVLDAGCGRADFLDFLGRVHDLPRQYIGLEAVDALAGAAERKGHPNATIIRGDFVQQPALLAQQAESIIFSGSLNTLSAEQFYMTLSDAWQSAGRELAFNFLCSPRLSAGKHLTWYSIASVLKFAESLSADVTVDDQYLDGDCTIAMRKA